VEFWIWFLIVMVVAVVKGLGKLQELAQEQPDESPVPPRLPSSRRPPKPLPQAREWKVDPEHLRQYVEKITGRAVAVPPPLPQTVGETAPPAVVSAPPAPPSGTERQNQQAAQWRKALHDRQNLRRIVIGAELIGPPKGMM